MQNQFTAKVNANHSKLLKAFLSFIVVAIGVCIFHSNSMASPLDNAKQSGYVGETESGYLKVVEQNNPPQDVYNLVKQINYKRKIKYKEIASSTQGADLASVERTIGKKLISRASPGEYVFIQGRWRQK